MGEIHDPSPFFSQPAHTTPLPNHKFSHSSHFAITAVASLPYSPTSSRTKHQDHLDSHATRSPRPRRKEVSALCDRIGFALASALLTTTKNRTTQARFNDRIRATNGLE